MQELITFSAQYLIVVPIIAAIYEIMSLQKPERIKFIAFLLVGGVLTILLVKLATSVYHDPRPFIRDGVVPFFKSSTDNGFPSDHTAFSMLLALVILHFSKWLGVSLLALSLVIGAARVTAGVHHGIDIIGGAFIALVAYGITLLIFKHAFRDLY